MRVLFSPYSHQNILYVVFFFFYFTILWWFLPYIHMTQPWVYMCSHPEPPSHLPLHPIPQGHPSTPALSTLSHASNLDWQSVAHMIIYMFQCYSLKSSHPHLLPQSPKVFFTSVSLLLSFTYSHHYHLSKFHIYGLVYSIGVFLLTYFTLYNRFQFHPPH